MDIAHNVSAVNQLTNTLRHLFSEVKWWVMFAVLQDKDWPIMLEKLTSISGKFYLVEIESPRAESPEKINNYLAQHWPEYPREICRNVRVGLGELRQYGRGLVVGSSYLVGDVLSIYGNESTSKTLDI